MKIITPKGTIVEGHMLTAEDVAVFAELTEPGLGIYAASPCYIPSHDIAKIAAYLITTFEMRRRVPLPEPEPAELAESTTESSDEGCSLKVVGQSLPMPEIGKFGEGNAMSKPTIPIKRPVGRPVRLYECKSCGKVIGAAAVRSHKC